MEILKVTNLKKYYGSEENLVKAVDDISLSIDEGDFVAVIGTSGSGKSTLLHMLGGLERPTSGEVIIDSNEIYHMNDDELTVFRRRNIGFIFQSYNLMPAMTVADNIILSIILDNGVVDREYYKRVLSMLGLEEKEKSYPGELSGGQQQRVAIARALITRPKIILADEPTGNLDSRNSETVVNILREANRSLSQTVIMITHDEKMASAANRIIRIEDGRLSAI